MFTITSPSIKTLIAADVAFDPTFILPMNDKPNVKYISDVALYELKQSLKTPKTKEEHWDTFNKALNSVVRKTNQIPMALFSGGKKGEIKDFFDKLMDACANPTTETKKPRTLALAHVVNAIANEYPEANDVIRGAFKIESQKSFEESTTVLDMFDNISVVLANNGFNLFEMMKAQEITLKS